MKIDWKKLFRGYLSWMFVEEFSKRKVQGYDTWTAAKHGLDSTLVRQRQED